MNGRINKLQNICKSYLQIEIRCEKQSSFEVALQEAPSGKKAGGLGFAVRKTLPWPQARLNSTGGFRPKIKANSAK